MARPRAAPKGRCCPDPAVPADGRVSMDWSAHKCGDRRPCRACREPALMRDCTGTPCHKTCAESEYGRDLKFAAARQTA